MTYFNRLKETHTKFGINYSGPARALNKEEYLFRVGAIVEELWEYLNCTFDLPDLDPNEIRQLFISNLQQYSLRDDVNSTEMLESQFDALVDLVVFAVGTGERQGFQFDEGFNRVMDANHKKELAGSSSNSKRGFSIDLIKPEGWQPPVLTDLVERPKGIIVLEGPDGTGKTSLAHFLIDNFNAEYIHHTWSPELEEEMADYQLNSINYAIRNCDEQLIVIDRSWISEFIYAEVFRNGTNWPDLAGQCHDLLRENKAIYIMCLPYTDNSVQQYSHHYDKLKEEREEMYTSMHDCFKAFSEFVFAGGQYEFGKKENTTNFFETHFKNGALLNMENVLLYDFFIDPNYEILTPYLEQNLKRIKTGEIE